jgi:hypothetical protein
LNWSPKQQFQTKTTLFLHALFILLLYIYVNKLAQAQRFWYQTPFAFSSAANQTYEFVLGVDTEKRGNSAAILNAYKVCHTRKSPSRASSEEG